MMSYLMDDISDAKLSIEEQGYDVVEEHTEACGYYEVYAAMVIYIIHGIFMKMY